ncbi:hypothetical protein AB4144_40780, partial [Rhizobiaceae sp. 2RAB30]
VLAGFNALHECGEFPATSLAIVDPQLGSHDHPIDVQRTLTPGMLQRTTNIRKLKKTMLRIYP